MRIALWALALVLITGAASAQQPPIFLSGGQLVNVVRSQVYPGVGVLCEGGKIAGLFFDFPYNDNRIPKNAVRIDVRGKCLVPGLMDMHVRAPTQSRNVPVDLRHFFKMFLAGGVTTVRAMTPGMDGVLHVKAEIDAEEADRSNIVVGSNPPMEQGPGFPRVERWTIVNTAQEAHFVHMGRRIGTGSDLQPVVPGLSMHQEKEALAAGGLRPIEALRASTIDAAKILGWDQRLGSIEVGKQADIVVIGGNPLADIRAVGNIDTMIQAGRVYKIAELKQALRARP